MPGIEYFFHQESEYENWRNTHRNTGFVISGFTNRKGTILWENKAPLYLANCPTLNRPEHKGRRTSYGKLCGSDERALIEDCNHRTGIQPKRCPHCFKPAT